MIKVYESNFRIFIKWLELMPRVLKEQGASYSSGDGGSIDIIMKAISALHNIKREKPSINVPRSDHFQVNSQWIDTAMEYLYSFNVMGDEYICSTVEAVIKCSGIKRLYDSYEQPFFFRGEDNFGWELKSRLGRKLKVDWSTTDPCKVTDDEKNLLAEFQSRCLSDHDTKIKVFGNSTPLDLQHSGWWSLMQHYDEVNGTRMIDITSSLYCALFFACEGWDSNVDTTIDGKLYMFPYQPGRGEKETPERIRGHLIGPEDQRKYTTEDYFDIEASLDYPRFRVSPVRNDRALSQDGYFVWQPYFDQPLKTFQIFPFRVHRDYKHCLLKELAAMGYTRDRILANNRFGRI